MCCTKRLKKPMTSDRTAGTLNYQSLVNPKKAGLSVQTDEPRYKTRIYLGGVLCLGLLVCKETNKNIFHENR